MGERLINAAGLSILHTTADMPPQVKLHVTTVKKGRKADWIPVPGMCTFLFVDLPHRMTKPQALEFLTNNENVKHILKKAGALDMSYMKDGSNLLENHHMVIEHNAEIEEEDVEEVVAPVIKKQKAEHKTIKAAAPRMNEIGLRQPKVAHPSLKTPKRP